MRNIFGLDIFIIISSESFSKLLDCLCIVSKLGARFFFAEQILPEAIRSERKAVRRLFELLNERVAIQPLALYRLCALFAFGTRLFGQIHAGFVETVSTAEIHCGTLQREAARHTARLFQCERVAFEASKLRFHALSLLAELLGLLFVLSFTSIGVSTSSRSRFSQ